METRFLENKKLQLVFDKVWIDPEKALDDLQQIQFTGGKNALSPAIADARLLELILNVLLQRLEGQDLEQQNLVAYYRSTKNYEKAALVTVWCMYGYITIGHMAQADVLRQRFPDFYTRQQSPLAYACYYVFSCLYSDKNGYYEDYVRLAREAEAVLEQYPVAAAWQRSLQCQARLYRSRTHSNYNKPAEAVAAMQQVEKEIKEYRLCSLLYEQTLYCYVMHYENSGKREKSLQVLEEIVTLALSRKYSTIGKFIAVANLVNTYTLRNRQISKAGSEYAANRQQQLLWLARVDELIASSFVTNTTAFYYYAKAGFLLQEDQPQQALQAIAKSIRIFYRLSNVRFLAQAYTAAHKIYKSQAIARADYRMAYKTARCADQMRLMTDKYYKQLLNRRIEAVELQFKIKEKELNEALLQQQITAMNKEVQLTTLNLHEKIQVLDEIKTYVNSLKRKELETRQLINTIARKIDSVKITEEEKATLQQKMGEGNQALQQVLAEKYPVLSSLEIRMCALFQTGLTNKELAKLYGQGEKSYEQHRYRIKKKMGLAGSVKLVNFLTQLTSGK